MCPPNSAHFRDRRQHAEIFLRQKHRYRRTAPERLCAGNIVFAAYSAKNDRIIHSGSFAWSAFNAPTGFRKGTIFDNPG
jgi:hypothetical protein